MTHVYIRATITTYTQTKELAMQFQAKIEPRGVNEDNGSVSFKVVFNAPCYQDAERYLDGTYGKNKWSWLREV